ncbi:MAG: NUDIX hydrolase [Candidatus Falkowbacteria bacterium GW2011_GWC2_38_22]|uniref:NUDIX hydrolase n=1 Tax=Candidatus Falkowbacteria bacterium GW2011_GWE1_38_31 TaxID=1618638 RepID=A0A0G0K599_9BACT|nr:MAG: NUDIX hydrolase [Candidatus Falkowbacteria bacterium GW2011_GWF2_38_1205]KKQ61653.1 MAG: NUDIX hydrolase [Candidatus Falkowbacteria bacterium GW2011_GWC2_38_22]KKQ63732.1 MAG: NUDIX hydrolase [Candidatus Falkowbacteria bacterium GW2011_GWF1_38_22]KKQ65852.1 MAG: NUDIX hydrolase [Candidatus Falkowbacteria bacterium GW2011_GWE2_38_254]KKQ70595.1 MAG: NUDIX hydrolase [Candidatus Falkowbacteria bacterium GW2011_GWE1_38_31]KKQ72991.1 MAG: NUDIX hydrolase [Candidatus Falkowbacteria bacterium
MSNIIKKYEYAVMATDTVLFALDDGKLKILLIKMNKKPFVDMWAVPGGLVRGDESVEVSAKRTLKEKTGVANVFMEQLYTFGNVNRDPFGRVVSIAYMALTPNIDMEIKTTKDHKEIGWFDVKDLPVLAYDHEKIVKTAVSRLSAKLEYTNIVFQLLSKEFTMNELQTAYEIIRGEKLDKRNFQKKILALDLVKKLDKKTTGQAHRPANVCTAKHEGVVNVEIL